MNTITIPKQNAAATVGKLLAVALDASATEAEATNAAARLVQVAQKHRVTLPALLQHFAIVKPQDFPPDDADVILHFGKYAGKSLGEILRTNPQYIRWLAAEATDEIVNLAASRTLRWWEDRP